MHMVPQPAMPAAPAQPEAADPEDMLVVAADAPVPLSPGDDVSGFMTVDTTQGASLADGTASSSGVPQIEGDKDEIIQRLQNELLQAHSAQHQLRRA